MAAGAIYYNNVLRSATLVSEDTISGFPAANALDGRTATQAGFLDGAARMLKFDAGANVSVNCLAIARHNMGTTSANIQLETSTDDITYSIKFNHEYTSNDVTCVKFTETSARYFKIYVLSSSADNYIADIFLGTGLALERSQRHGFIKPEFADGDQVLANTTRGKNLAGLNVYTGLKRCKFDLFYYTASFMNSWAALVAVMKQYPIYIEWDDTETPFYCWPTKKIPEPEYSKNIQNYYSVVLDMEGITT